MRSLGLYLGSSALLVAAVGAGVVWFAGSQTRHVVVLSAALALVVQAAAFLVARSIIPRSLMVGWGLGSLMRFVAVVLYALVVAKLWRPELTPALLSFVGFLFVTMLVEPLFLKR